MTPVFCDNCRLSARFLPVYEGYTGGKQCLFMNKAGVKSRFDRLYIYKQNKKKQKLKKQKLKTSV